MNKHLHRIVFNATRACQMAVAETSRAHGKAAAGERGAACTHAAPPVGFHLNRLQWVCWLSIGAVMALNTSPAALAQTVVIADPNAPRNQQPTVLRSGNQTVQVNIQTPNAAGLSRNSYKQFDVMADGVILNNSRTNVSTQLGGWVSAAAKYGVDNIHPLDNYIAKPQSQSIMFDWQKQNPKAAPKP